MSDTRLMTCEQLDERLADWLEQEVDAHTDAALATARRRLRPLRGARERSPIDPSSGRVAPGAHALAGSLA